MRIAAIMSFAVALATCADAKPNTCRTTVTGIPDATGSGCAGITLCVDGESPSCDLHGTVRVRTKRGKTMRLAAEPGSRCIVAQPAGGLTPTERIRIRARVGKGGQRRIRLDPVLSCSRNQPPGSGDEQCSGLTLPLPAVGRRAHFPPSIPTPGTCGDSGSASNYTTPPHLLPAEQAAELHVASVYEPECRRMAEEWPYPCLVPHEPVTVVVEPRPKPVVLVLTAYDPVTWRIDVRSGAIVERVLVGGSAEQTVTGVPPDVVKSLAVQQYAYGWEVSATSGDGGLWPLIAGVRAETGLVEASFQGCYTGARFTIPYATDPPTTCEASPVAGDETLPQASIGFPECPSVERESAACISVVRDRGLALIGADSGTICPLAAQSAGVSMDPTATSVGWLGEVLYRCSHNEGLVRIDLRTGASESLEMPCEAVTDDAGTLLIAPGLHADFGSWGSVYRVSGYAGLLAAEATRTVISTLNSAFTAHAGLLYSAWHASDTIYVQDIATGAAVSQVSLAGYDGWIFGLDVTDDGRLFVAGMDDAGTLLMIFDAASGTRLGEHRLGGYWGASGLACRAAYDTPT